MNQLKVPEVVPLLTGRIPNHYFNNDVVEEELRQYQFTACTSVKLRDTIMFNASELIRQIIRVHGLQRLSDSNEDELTQVGWIQIERTLYKYKARVHCAKCYDPNMTMTSIVYDPKDTEFGLKMPEDVAEGGYVCPSCGLQPNKIMYRGISKIFNLWSSVARTSILAYIKKNTRDTRYTDGVYFYHVTKQRAPVENPLIEFFNRAEAVVEHDPVDKRLLNILRVLSEDGFVGIGITGALVSRGQVSRVRVTQFLARLRIELPDIGDALGEKRMTVGDMMGTRTRE